MHNYFTGIMIIRHCFKSSVVTTYPFAQKGQFQLVQNILYSLIFVSEIFTAYHKLQNGNIRPLKMDKTSRKVCRNRYWVSTGKVPCISTQNIPKLLYRIPPDYIIFFSLKSGALGILLKNVASIVL